MPPSRSRQFHLNTKTPLLRSLLNIRLRVMNFVPFSHNGRPNKSLSQRRPWPFGENICRTSTDFRACRRVATLGLIPIRIQTICGSFAGVLSNTICHEICPTFFCAKSRNLFQSNSVLIIMYAAGKKSPVRLEWEQICPQYFGSPRLSWRCWRSAS